MYTISKEFTFSASHQLSGLPEDHPCTRLHGHNYKVQVILGASNLDETGFVLDYRKMDKVKQMLDANFDHKHLNDVVKYNPTAENLARHIYATCSSFWPVKIIAVRVSETEKTWAEYSEKMDRE